MTNNLPEGKVIAIDYGLRKFGVAISDQEQTFASTLPVGYLGRNGDITESIDTIAKKNNAKNILLGLPLGNNDNLTKISKLVLELKDSLEKKYNYFVDTIDEVMTSRAAKESSKGVKYKKGDIDSEAARIFLQEYLDFKNQGF